LASATARAASATSALISSLSRSITLTRSSVVRTNGRISDGAIGARTAEIASLTDA
jgi:hypothetical protein